MDIEFLKKRLNEINWTDYSHPCSPSSSFSNLSNTIVNLYSTDTKTSENAANNLWNDVAHQGNIGSISVPICPFLIERIEIDTHVEVFSDLMEILYYFSCGLKPPDKTKWSSEQIENEKKSFNYPDDYKWTFELRKILCSRLEFFMQLKNHSNEDVVDYTEMILENINPYCE